jgi:hypothetical protein
MRSAAEGEHRTGEERLDGIARRCAILPEMGDRYAVERHIVLSDVEVVLLAERRREVFSLVQGFFAVPATRFVALVFRGCLFWKRCMRLLWVVKG